MLNPTRLPYVLIDERGKSPLDVMQRNAQELCSLSYKLPCTSFAFPHIDVVDNM